MLLFYPLEKCDGFFGALSLIIQTYYRVPNKHTPVRGRILENVSRCIALFGTEYALKFLNPCQGVFLFGTVHGVFSTPMLKVQCYMLKVIKSWLNFNKGLHHCFSVSYILKKVRIQVHVVVLVCWNYILNQNIIGCTVIQIQGCMITLPIVPLWVYSY